MSEQNNIQIVQKLYSSFGAGDMEGILSTLDENIDWIFTGKPQDVPFAGHYEGRAAMIEFFTVVAQNVENIFEFGPDEIHAMGEVVLVLGHEKVQARATGKVFETTWAHVFTVRGGKIVRLREFYDTATMAVAFRKD